MHFNIMLVPIEKHFTSTRRILIIYRYIMYLLGFNFPQALANYTMGRACGGIDLVSRDHGISLYPK